MEFQAGDVKPQPRTRSTRPARIQTRADTQTRFNVCMQTSRRPDRAAAMTSWPDSARATSRIKKNPMPTGLEPATSTCVRTSRVALYRLGYGRRRSRDCRIYTLTPLRPSAAGRAHGIAAERPAKQAHQTHPPERSRKALCAAAIGTGGRVAGKRVSGRQSPRDKEAGMQHRALDPFGPSPPSAFLNVAAHRDPQGRAQMHPQATTAPHLAAGHLTSPPSGQPMARPRKTWCCAGTTTTSPPSTPSLHLSFLLFHLSTHNNASHQNFSSRTPARRPHRLSK
jgi:hypothetical protein